jgi:PAS domain-containing protein
MEPKMAIIHEGIVLKMGVALLSSRTNSLQELGELLVETSSDLLPTGGLWLWDHETNEVFYSPKFCEALGYKYKELGTGFDGFNLANKDHLDHGLDMINKLIETNSNDTFINNIDYTAKDGSIVHIICRGTVFFIHNKPEIILGTHKIATPE